MPYVAPLQLRAHHIADMLNASFFARSSRLLWPSILVGLDNAVSVCSIVSAGIFFNVFLNVPNRFDFSGFETVTRSLVFNVIINAFYCVFPLADTPNMKMLKKTPTTFSMPIKPWRIRSKYGCRSMRILSPGLGTPSISREWQDCRAQPNKWSRSGRGTEGLTSKWL